MVGAVRLLLGLVGIDRLFGGTCEATLWAMTLQPKLYNRSTCHRLYVRSCYLLSYYNGG